jgi:hypothetical protein
MDFDKILAQCEMNSAISARVIDDFLIDYAAESENLPREMNVRFGAFRHIVSQFQPPVVNAMKAQYIGHRIFRQGGYLKKYLNHSAIKRLDPDGRQFLVAQSQASWKFSFSIIKDNPAENFYTMYDVFTGESFLLHSNGVTAILKEKQVTLWLNLIGFNGHCWQSFGPIYAYQSFDPDDIFFFATELSIAIESEEDLLADVERNPVPYMMLFIHSQLPLTAHKKDELIQLVAWYEKAPFDTDRLKKDFKVEYTGGVYRLGLKGMDKFPHFAMAFYKEDENLLNVVSMTARGFQKLVKKLNNFNFGLSEDPEVRVHPAMLYAANSILKKEIDLNPLDKLFHEETSTQADEHIDKMNELIRIVLPDINAGRTPDIENLAQRAGLDTETAKAILESMIKTIKAMKEDPGER